jgi:hypothetical protein
MVTVITKTIGSGKDYASFTLAEADVTNIGTSADLVANDEAIVFEADAGTYDEQLQVVSAIVADATRNVTYKPAAGSEHGGSSSSGVILYRAGTGQNGHLIDDDFTVVQGLVAKQVSSAAGRVPWTLQGNNLVVRDCIGFDAGTGSRAFHIQGGGITLLNCVANAPTYYAFDSDIGVGNRVDLINCTAIGNGSNAAFTLSDQAIGNFVNCLNLRSSGTDWRVFGSGHTITGSNNFGSNATFGFPAAIQGSPYPITASTAYDPGAGDFALYVSKNGALLDSPNNDVIDGGVGPSVNSDVPTTDILGNARSGATANPGAFEVPQGPTVLTRTIGSGKNYANFTLAEADVTNIGTSADLLNENEAIVFEADAGTYDGLIFDWTLTTDATRNVTFKPATGSEHGGVFGAGVILQDNTSVTSYIAMMINASTNHCVFDGIAFNVRSGVTSSCTAIRSGVGHIWRNCLFSSEGTGSLNRSEDGYSSGSAVAPIVYENCVTKGEVAYVFNSDKTGSSMRFVNCTHLTSDQMFRFYTYAASSQAAEIVNCVNLGGGESLQDLGPTATAITGSNNFGGSTKPFPVSIQGTPYPVTATTDLDPGPGDWAIYDATNGALIDDPDNDVLAGGIGPDANPDVPTTDIIGNPRTGLTTEPGAFVLPPPPVVEEDTWTPVMVRRNDPVDVYGVLTFGDAYINAVEDTLSVTGADGTDATPAIPVGTRALWIQLVSQTGAAAGETCDVSIEVSASQSLTLATLNGAGTAVGNVPGLMQFPVDCLGQNDPDTPVYPRVKMVTGSTVGASDVVTIRVVAICGQQTNTTWS